MIESLNVKPGDCFHIHHHSGRHTLIDICSGNLATEPMSEAKKFSQRMESARGNFKMCEHPMNPLSFLAGHNVSTVFRFILTHPDLDHMDGIARLFNDRTVVNFWHSGVTKEKPDFSGSPFKEEDWDLYSTLTDEKVKNITVLSPQAGNSQQFWGADDEDGNGSGDCLTIVAPDLGLVDNANESGDINDASYVIVYRTTAGKVIFAGDSHDKTWEFILTNYKDSVADAAVLFAPHHGRKSGRDYAFLDTVRPRITFFGCAPSKDLAYSAWTHRELPYFTRNQCGHTRILPSKTGASIYIENENFAKAHNPETTTMDGYWLLAVV